MTMRNRQQFGDSKSLGSMFPTADYEWNDIVIPTISLAVGGAAPTVAVSNNIRYYAFVGDDSGTPDDELHGALEILHDYAEGTDMYLHIHYFGLTAVTGNIVWGVDYTILNHTHAASSYTGVTTLTESVTTSRLGLQTIKNIATISGLNRTIGDTIMFRIYRPRIATQTHKGFLGVVSVGIHYAINSLGSKGITTK